MDLERSKRQCNAFKGHLTRNLTKLSEKLSKDEAERNIELIKQYLKQVEVKYEKWEKCMLELQMNEEEDIDSNIDSIDKTLDAVIKIKVEANDIIVKSKK